MREHPIPQDVTGYKFHIVGNMTIKQFAEIAAGVGIAFLFYLTNLPNFIKWPIMFGFGIMGIALAFLPIEERPLDHWIFTFFKTLYKPTKFFWKRELKIPDFFKHQTQTFDNQETEVDFSPAKRQRINEYLKSIDINSQSNDDFTDIEKNKISQIINSFDEIIVPNTEINVSPKKPNLKIRVRELRHKKSNLVNIDPNIVVYQKEAESPQIVHHQEINQNSAYAAQTDLIPSSQAVDPILQIDLQQQTALPQQTFNQQSQQLTQNTSHPTEQQASIRVVQEKSVTIEPKHQLEQQEKENSLNQSQDNTFINSDDLPNQNFQNQDNMVVAQTNPNLPFPSIPNEPNKIVGMILTKNNELINDSIVEIIDQNGQIVRAVKSNSLGQFFISTPLNNGVYTIRPEKAGFSFNNIQLELTGEIVLPLEIRSL